MQHGNIHSVILKTLLLCFFSGTLYGQNDSIKIAAIDAYVKQIDPFQVQLDSFTFIIDSIQVDGIKYRNAVVTKSLFKKSKTVLTTTFYLKDKKMFFAKVVEPSPKKGFEKMYRSCAFYFENNIVISQRCRSTRQLGLVIDDNGSNVNIYGYNASLTFDFLKKYVTILYDRL